MKFIILFIASGLLALALGPFLPFWVLMLSTAAIAALVGGKRFYSFLAGAMGWGTVWLWVPLRIVQATGSELPEKIAGIMGVPDENYLIATTALIGFLVGGFGALTGNLFGKLFEKDKGRF